METKVDRKNKCTCGTGVPCCVHEVEKGKEEEAKMSGGCCEPGCGPGVCK